MPYEMVVSRILGKINFGAFAKYSNIPKYARTLFNHATSITKTLHIPESFTPNR